MKRHFSPHDTVYCALERDENGCIEELLPEIDQMTRDESHNTLRIADYTLRRA